MRFSPWCIIFIFSGVPCVEKLRDFLHKMPDSGLEVHLPIPVSGVFPLKKNKIVYDIDAGEINNWKSQMTGCTVSINWNPQSFTTENLCSELLSIPVKERCHLQLLVNECSPEELLTKHDIIPLFRFFSEITVSNEYEDGHYAMSLASSLLTHRRPCKHPFETVVIDEDGNVRACPYCEDIITRFSTWNDLLSDRKYLLFLASQLTGMPSSVSCKNCLYWLDGWLGNETTKLTAFPKCPVELYWEGHGCQIRLENKQ